MTLNSIESRFCHPQLVSVQREAGACLVALKWVVFLLAHHMSDVAGSHSFPQ